MRIRQRFCFYWKRVSFRNWKRGLLHRFAIYNLVIRSYIVIELKTTEFKSEYIGKLNFYLSAIDKYVKKEEDNPTIGILLCKDKNKITIDLALKDINKPIGISEYKILSEIPKYLENTLPNLRDMGKRLEKQL